jgi:hypothetical protein
MEVRGSKLKYTSIEFNGNVLMTRFYFEWLPGSSLNLN